jgi:hypothetical protein
MTQQTPSDPQALREQIEQTRADLGETVEALAAKTNLAARARNAASRVRTRAVDLLGTVATVATRGVVKVIRSVPRKRP